MGAVTAGRRQMEFQSWTPATVLEPSRFGVPVPSPPTHAVRPDLVFVPLLAADRKGWRIGYGAGYYDFALRELRRDGGDLIAVGLCFEGQLVDAVPHHDGDERLDWIVTEAGVFRTVG